MISLLLANATITAKLRSTGTSVAITLSPGGVKYLPGYLYQSFHLSTSNVLLSWESLPLEELPPPADFGGLVSAQQSGTWTVVPSLSLAIVDNQAFDGSIANGTADAVSQAGAVAVPFSTLVRFRLAAAGIVITAADLQVYVAIVGNVSGTVYAKCFAGPTEVTGSFRMPQSGAGEKLDIHTRNADTVAHLFSAAWEALSGE